MSPTLSIVMPAYNASTHLPEAIRSLLSQSSDDWELIVADDCSTDKTCQIVTDFATYEPRVRLIRLKTNSGSAFRPRAEAVKEANGKYVVELDSDDYLEPSYVADAIKRIDETGADIVFGNLSFIYHDGRSSRLTTDFNRSRTIPGRDHLKYTLNHWGDGCRGAIRTELYKRALATFDDDENSMSADELLIRKCLIMAEKLAFFESCYFYRIHESSITKAQNIRQFDILDTDTRLKALVFNEFPTGAIERRLVNDQLISDLWSSIIEFSKFPFKSKEEREKVYKLLTAAYRVADIGKARKCLGDKRTALLQCGLKNAILINKLINRFGKRRHLQEYS